MKRCAPLRRTGGLARHTRLRARALRPKRRAREEAEPESIAYRAWLHTMPCAGCGNQTGVVAHHAGQHGLGEKCHWREQIPLDSCHDDLHAARGRFANQNTRRIWEQYVIAACQELYAEWSVNRRNGTMGLTDRALLMFSIAWEKARRGVEP